MMCSFVFLTPVITSHSSCFGIPANAASSFETRVVLRSSHDGSKLLNVYCMVILLSNYSKLYCQLIIQVYDLMPNILMQRTPVTDDADKGYICMSFLITKRKEKVNK